MHFSFKHNIKLVEEPDIRYKEIKIKQQKHKYHLGCGLNETMPGEKMALTIIEKNQL